MICKNRVCSLFFFFFCLLSTFLSDQTLIENVWNFTLKTQKQDQTTFEIHHIYPHSKPKFSQREMRLLKLVSPHFSHLMLSHHGRNIFSASEWLIIPDMRVVPSIAMMSELSYYQVYNNKILKMSRQMCRLGLLVTASSARRQTLANK